MNEKPEAVPAVPEAPLVNIPVPRVVGWAVSRIGWGGVGLLVVAAQAAGWLDNVLALAGLPPMSFGTAPEAPIISPAADAPSQVFVSELLYTRAIQEQILRKVDQIESGCLSRRKD